MSELMRRGNGIHDIGRRTGNREYPIADLYRIPVFGSKVRRVFYDVPPLPGLTESAGYVIAVIIPEVE